MLENWRIFVGICAGIVTLITFLDKVGVTGRVKRIRENAEKLAEITDSITNAVTAMNKLAEQQEAQREALLALIRNALFRSFKEHRDIEAWTDEECMVQTRLHEAYIANGGNGEEAIWWDKKKTWEIVSVEEHKRRVEARKKND